jgi:hypothetical protein
VERKQLPVVFKRSKDTYLHEFYTAPVYWCIAHIKYICRNNYVFSWDISSPLETCRNDYSAFLTAEEAGIGAPLFIHTSLPDKITQTLK